MTKYFLLRRIHNIYDPEGNKNIEPMAIVAYFLTDDVQANYNSFRDWIYDDTQLVTGGNRTGLDKTEKDIIILTDLFTDDESYCIEMSKEQFINMLDGWKQIRQLNPPFILVSQDPQGNIHFQPLDEPIENG